MAEKDGTSDTKWAIGYLILMIILMYYVNQNIMNEKCGFTTSSVIFKATFLPWILIFGVVMAVLIAAPGWKGPFSNTIGYMIVKMSGGEKALLDILNKTQGRNCPEANMNGDNESGGDATTGGDGGGDGGSAAIGAAVGDSLPANTQGGGGLTYRRKSPKAQRGGDIGDVERSTELKKEGNKADDVVCMIYHDPGPLINQFTMADFPVGVLKLKNMLTLKLRDNLRDGFPYDDPLTSELWKPLGKFRNMIFLKDLVAEWIWYILTGSIVLATSDNIIMNSSCAKSIDDATDYHDDVINDADNPDPDDTNDTSFTQTF